MASKKKISRINKPVEESFFASPLYDFLSPFRPVSNQWLTEYIIVIFALIVRCAIGLGSYSGMGNPPMFGDFEAQRHWMEITQHLPISKWYFFDLEYWGLDYPPLTAYHSYVLGVIGSFLNKSWFALNDSRGYESENNDLKTYMRTTVIISEIIFYIPGVIYFTKWVGRHRQQSLIGQYIAAAAILFQPSLMLIDHGHFQYNSVMLGLTVYAINNLLDEFYAPAAMCFVLSICFKQMALYYAPIFFGYLLGRSLFSRKFFNISRFLSIAISTVFAFFSMYAPLYVFGGGLRNVIQSVHRIFPFARGLFEDKVANFWCVTNIFIKYKILYTQKELQLYSLIATVVGFLPAVVTILFYPKKHLLPYALAACSMSFYLFSFQVHEKTILVPLLPITLLYTSTDWNVLSFVSWVNNVGLFTLWPLLKKDGLTLQYGVCFFLSNWLIGNFSFITPKFLPKMLTPGPPVQNTEDTYHRRSLLPHNILWKIIIVSSYIVMLLIHLGEIFVSPPPEYPDIWVLMNCCLGFGCFVLFWLWNYYKIFTLANKTLQYL
ncbi:hypothetical protein Kpol_1037p27 [Vanderwaltozyma polyspora DSM 70294]|uniref:Alpha-1,3-glucosyltransferase n=1 Tax=Vanderwaltozyma polyspora (strain ATCC 22028 / DSM 70294 / BCRC 21397 / CBS 2163 / NBRC 10782 / NRRL Y-8283 / UCD 57-17) TaxID=436907 RepID=A7TJW9_VANPO|nr:uncharacterized protein Kpol_1037p27 [Vanderwaltozyma polyspora DSM 70294]EDO17431.1 hypothetical protein Kpol_1037p27 [Vanderwaltozyma polyspora DSM 70294]